jgi:hypothetical protein
MSPVTDSANTVSVNVLPDIPETEKTTKPDSKVIMRNKKGKKSKKLSKDDVGGPVNFVHVSHMSWSVDDGPHVRNFLKSLHRHKKICLSLCKN